MTRGEKKKRLARWRHIEEGCLLFIENKLEDGAVDNYQYGGRSLKYYTPKQIADILALAERKANDLEAELEGKAARGYVVLRSGYGAQFNTVRAIR